MSPECCSETRESLGGVPRDSGNAPEHPDLDTSDDRFVARDRAEIARDGRWSAPAGRVTRPRASREAADAVFSMTEAEGADGATSTKQVGLERNAGPRVA